MLPNEFVLTASQWRFAVIAAKNWYVFIPKKATKWSRKTMIRHPDGCIYEIKHGINFRETCARLSEIGIAITGVFSHGVWQTRWLN